MTYLGDYAAGCAIFNMFTLTDTSGRPTALGGNPSPCLIVYRTDQGGSACTTAGITLAISCNGLTGANAWSVNTEIDKAFYACGRQYQVLISGGCVDSICVSNYVVGRFSLAATSALRPNVPGRCLAMTALGQVEPNTCSAIFSVQKLIEKPITDACSTIFSVVKLIEKPVVDACSTIFSVQKLIDKPIIDACSTVFSVTKTVDTNPCGAVYSVVKLLDRPLVDACSTMFSVQKVIERPVTDPCSTIFSVVKLIEKPVVDSCSTIFSVQRIVDPDTILDKAIVEPAAVFTWPATLRGIIAWLGAVASNQIKQEAGQQGVCDRAVSTTIAKATTTDDGTTATRGSFT